MNVKYLEYILEVAKCGSINRAAQNLYLSQPNLSSIIKSIEKDLNIKIFQRYNKGIKLTADGNLFISSAQIIVSEMENIKRIPLINNKGTHLSISCTYSSTFMESFMEFKAKYPSVEIEDSFKETGLIQTIQDVIEKKYNLSLFYCFDCRVEEHRKKINQYNLEMVELATNIKPLALVSSTGIYKKEQTISYSQLTTEHFVTYENFKYEDWLSVLGRDKHQKTMYIFDRGGLVDSVTRSNYISVVMGKISKQQQALGCKTLAINDFPNYLNVYLVKHNNVPLSTKEKQFLKILKKNLEVV